jgi:hypothetical protein
MPSAYDDACGGPEASQVGSATAVNILAETREAPRHARHRDGTRSQPPGRGSGKHGARRHRNEVASGKTRGGGNAGYLLGMRVVSPGTAWVPSEIDWRGASDFGPQTSRRCVITAGQAPDPRGQQLARKGRGSDRQHGARNAGHADAQAGATTGSLPRPCLADTVPGAAKPRQTA